jgi:DNA-binding CsgD family transcriptional regulator
VWERHRPQVEALSQMTNSCIFVTEPRNGPYHYLSPNLACFGYEIPEGNRSDDGWFLEHRIHPEDLKVFNETLDHLYDFIRSLPQEQQQDYKHIFEFRALDKTDKWIRVVSQHQIIDFLPDGLPILLGAVDLSPDQTPNMGLRFTLMNYKTGEIVPFSVHEEADLSPREKQILKLIDEGMYSKEISDKLSISIHTVNRHRQNILQKLGAGNTREAANYARRLGLFF